MSLKRLKVYLYFALGLSLGLFTLPSPVSGAQAAARSPSRSIACPTELAQLTPFLLRDLPSYANRVTQRARNRSRTPNPAAYIIVAGRPEFKPLPLNLQRYGAPAEKEPEQLFITTLEREYVGDRIVDIQVFHWLFLVQTQQGRQLAMMFSQVGSYPAGKPPSPIEDTSDGIIASAVKDWLRDCAAGAIRPSKR